MKDFSVSWLAIACCTCYNVHPLSQKVRVLETLKFDFFFQQKGKLNVGVD